MSKYRDQYRQSMSHPEKGEAGLEASQNASGNITESKSVDYGLGVDVLTPIMKLLVALEPVALGGSMQPVQVVVNDVLAGMDREDADELLIQVKRARDAAERLYQMCFEGATSKHPD